MSFALPLSPRIGKWTEMSTPPISPTTFSYIPWPPHVHSARLQLGPLGVILRSPMALALLAIFIGFIEPWAALPVLLLAELLERQLFFQSVHAPKMPGNFGPKGRH